MLRHTLLVIALLAVTPAMAGPRDEVYSASARCAAISDDRAWLECYYGAAQPMRGQLQLPPAPAAQTALIPPASAATTMGAPAAYQPPRIAAPARPGPVARTLDYLGGGDAVVSKVAVKSYEGGGAGGFIVTLANGQTWKQTDDQARFTRWRGGPEAHHVTIWKGALNTFNLGFDDESDRYKVRRVK